MKKLRENVTPHQVNYSSSNLREAKEICLTGGAIYFSNNFGSLTFTSLALLKAALSKYCK